MASLSRCNLITICINEVVYINNKRYEKKGYALGIAFAFIYVLKKPDVYKMPFLHEKAEIHP
jgi:hypothetical protein